MLGVADRVAAPLGGIDAGTASWTIGAEEDVPRVRMSMPHCQLISGEVLSTRRARASVPSRQSAAREAPGAAARSVAALIKYG
jgi:hypothetical protein